MPDYSKLTDEQRAFAAKLGGIDPSLGLDPAQQRPAAFLVTIPADAKAGDTLPLIPARGTHSVRRPTIVDDNHDHMYVTASEAKELAKIGAIQQMADNAWFTLSEWDVDAIEDQLHQWHADATEHRELMAAQDTPSIANCDDAGTGEGQFHGRM